MFYAWIISKLKIKFILCKNSKIDVYINFILFSFKYILKTCKEKELSGALQ